MSRAGVPIDLALVRGMPLPALPEDSDKDARGQVLVIAGGPAVPGAPILTGLAALRSGAGKLQLAAIGEAALPLGMAVPEAAIVSVDGEPDGEMGLNGLSALSEAAGRADAVVVGPGMMGKDAAQLAAGLMAASARTAFVVDAGAMTGLLNLLSTGAAAKRRLVLTPHGGEMAKMLGWSRKRVDSNPAAAARLAAQTAGAVVALKGETTYIADPDGQLWVHDGGAVGLGTSGSGDVLAGVIGGLLARGATPEAAVIRGVFIHGQAGKLLTEKVGALGFLAREILDVIPTALTRSSPGSP